MRNVLDGLRVEMLELRVHLVVALTCLRWLLGIMCKPFIHSSYLERILTNDIHAALAYCHLLYFPKQLVMQLQLVYS